MSTNVPEPKSSVEFLMDEARSYQEAFWKNEEAGERRVTFLVTLITAVIAGLVALANASADTQSIGKTYLFEIAIISILALLVVGCTTYFRMIQRNKVTDLYKSHAKYVRFLLQKRGIALADYRPFPNLGRGSAFRGGLADIAGLLNAMLISMMIFLTATHLETGSTPGNGWQTWAWIFAFAGFVLASAAFWWNADRARHMHRRQLNKWEATWE